MVSSTQEPKGQSSRKTIYIIAVLGCLILWIAIYSPSIDLTALRKLQYPHASENTIAESDFEQNITIQNSSKELCTPETFNHGRWVYAPLITGNDFTGMDIARAAGYHCMKKFAHRCYRTRTGNELVRVKKITDYRWRTDSCNVVEMNIKKLANHLTKHPILFVGDSITQLQYESLSCLLGEQFPNRKPGNSTLNGGDGRIKVSQQAPLDKGTASMAYIRSDYLLRLSDYKMASPFEEEGPQLGSGENHPWAHTISQFDYIVINTGPHWHPGLQWGPNESQAELLAAFKKAMKVILDHLKENLKPHQKVWIRSTPYGHAKCSEFIQPQVNPVEPAGRAAEYEWHLFKKFDKIWRDLLKDESKNDPRFDMLDISTLSNQRGDAHSKPDKDCLHTCLPGPVDEWNRLLNHEIMKRV